MENQKKRRNTKKNAESLNQLNGNTKESGEIKHEWLNEMK